MIHPYISYCNIVWASNYPTKLLKLHSLQSRAVRMVFGPTCRLPTDQMYKEVNILKPDQICTFQISEFMFKNHCSLLPNTFFDYFTTVSSINPTCCAILIIIGQSLVAPISVNSQLNTLVLLSEIVSLLI